MANTTLWFVYLTLEHGEPTVLVSDRHLSVVALETRRIRSITPNAAGRRYVRNNLETALASYEGNAAIARRPAAHDDGTTDPPKRVGGARNRATIKVMREPVRPAKPPRPSGRGRKGRQ